MPDEDLVDGTDRISDPKHHGPSIWLHMVPEAKQVKNRLHIDVHASGEADGPDRHTQRASRRRSRPDTSHLVAGREPEHAIEALPKGREGPCARAEDGFV